MADKKTPEARLAEALGAFDVANTAIEKMQARLETATASTMKAAAALHEAEQEENDALLDLGDAKSSRDQALAAIIVAAQGMISKTE